MATRPVFYADRNAAYHSVFNAEFTWAGGFALSQKQKNITAIHRCFVNACPNRRALEISSKSTEPVGISASAFFLKKFVPSLNRSIPVENIFQGSKVFRNGGPFTDLLGGEPIDAKRDPRLINSGALVGFRFEGADYPLVPKTVFYDFIYINALLENPEVANELLKYDGFTDIAFNPEKSLNCQARSAAIFVSLSRQGLLDNVKDFSSYLALFQRKVPPKESEPKACTPSAPKQNAEAPEIKVGDTVIHKVFGEGTVLAVSSHLTVSFASVGEKVLGIAWVRENCGIKAK